MKFVYLGITFLIILNSFTSVATEASLKSPRTVSCAEALGGLEIPVGWGIAPAEFAAVANDIKALAPTLRKYAEFLRFVVDPHHAEFFEYLGNYANFGYATNYLRDKGHGALEDLGVLNHRLTTMQQLVQAAASDGLIKERLDGFYEILLTEALGELSFERPHTREDFKRDFYKDVQKFLSNQREDLPSLRKLLSQSVAAQMAISDLLISGHKAGFLLRLERVAPLLGDRLRGVVAQETAAEKTVLDEIENITRGHHPDRFLPQNFASNVTRKVRREYVDHLNRDFTGYVLNGILRSLLGSILNHLEPTEDSDIIRNPILMMAAFDRALSAQTMIDQGLNPFLRRAFAAVVFKKNSLDAESVLGQIKKQVVPHLKQVRASWRTFKALEDESAKRQSAPLTIPPSTPLETSGLSREERKARYVAKVTAEVEQELNLTGLLEAPGRQPEVARDLGPNDLLWDQLTNRDMDLASARQLFRQTIAPDTPIEVTGQRAGFNYRFELSERLIRKLLKPDPSHPQDLRVWLDAFRLGRARPQVERGLTKLRHSIGIYTYALTLTSSEYCLLGYRTRERGGRFELIDLVH